MKVQTQHPAHSRGDKWTTVQEVLSDPPAEFRAVPLWAWNDQLDEGTLRRQVALHAEAGLGGFFIHARAGLRAEYLTDQWSHFLRVVIDEAKKFDLFPWFYDEWGWPSGMAGGRIPALGEEYQQKFLTIEECGKAEAFLAPGTLAVYDEDGAPVTSPDETVDRPVLRIHVRTNSAYADVLYSPAISRFIESTYDWHRERHGEDLGGRVPGFFTDEPQYGRYAFPWSMNLDEQFEARFGYPLLPNLLSLFRNVGDWRSIRHDFWLLVADSFVTSYAQPLGAWCERNDCILTGHVLLEEDCRWQTLCAGTAQGFYRHQQVPGIDWLGRTIGNVVIGKQVSSVADQMGRRLVLSEMFAAGGWNASLEELKWIAEWQFVTGINLMCPHLEPYTLRGSRKRDHPPFPFFQAPWWPDYRAFNDYFARLSALMAMGRTAAEVLVLHPVRTAWMEMDQEAVDGNRNASLRDVDDSLEHVCTLLSAAHIDYHLGDEAMLADLSRIEGNALLLGDYRYRVVILPSVGTLTESTVALLHGAITAGIPVLSMGRLPDRIDGRLDARASDLAAHFIRISSDPKGIAEAMKGHVRPRVRLEGNIPRDRGVILSLAKQYTGADGAFIVNTDRHAGYRFVVHLDGEGPLCEVDLSSGASTLLSQDGSAVIELRPAQSRFLFRAPGTAKSNTQKAIHQCIELAEWKMRPSDPNALILDLCRWREKSRSWSDWMPVPRARREVLNGGIDFDMEVEYRFESADSFHPGIAVELVVEEATKNTIMLNEVAVAIPARPSSWIDECFHGVPIPGLIRKGTNVVRVSRRLENDPNVYEQMRRAARHEQVENMLAFDTELEAIYLRGEFTVRAQGNVREALRESSGQRELHATGPMILHQGLPDLAPCNVTAHGFPFYRGSLLLRQEFDWTPLPGKVIFFRMDRPDAASGRIRVNGVDQGTISWAPFEREITPALQAGKNEIELVLRGTNRNLFGPHHHPMGELLHMGPHQYEDTAGWSDDYCLVPFGPGPRLWLEIRDRD